MALTRRAMIASGSALLLPRGPARAQATGKRPVRIGVLTDLSGTYRDISGPTAVACVRQAVQEFTSGRDMAVEVLAADFQNKADIGAGIARQWFDQQDVDMVVDLTNSAVALAVSGVARDKNKVVLISGAATSEITGKQCSPNTVHWTFDTWMLAKSTATSVMRTGGDTWFLLAPDYTFGQQLAHDTARFITEAGGRVLGSALYPFPDTSDFSAYLLQAKASGAKVLGLCNAGIEAASSIKQAHEFGLNVSMRLAALATYLPGVHALGSDVAQGLHLTESFYWDLNERTRAFMDRVKPKVANNWPCMIPAGDYAATLHYLKAVADIGVEGAKADGRAVVARMKAMPTDDDCFGKGLIREDGRKIHPSHLFEVKQPAQSTQQWDLYKWVATVPAEDAFRPMAQGGCPLVHT